MKLLKTLYLLAMFTIVAGFNITPAFAETDSVTLTASAGDGEVTLSWSDPESGSNYQIYYDTDSDPSGRSRIDTVSSDVLSYTVSGLSNGTTYWFWIKFKTSSGSWSNSNSASATPSDSSDETITLSGSAGDSSVSLTWSDPGNSTTYQVYQDTDSDPSGRTRIAKLSYGTNSYTATDLDNGTTYWFWIKFKKSDGTYDNSNSFSATPESASSDIDENATIVSTASDLLSAISSAAAGDTIYISGGTYYLSDTIELEQSGTSSSSITLSKYPDDSSRPVLDFSAMSESSSNRGIELSGDYWTVYGIDVQYAGDNGMHITGSNNLIEFSTFSRNADTGLQLDSGASNNVIKNVDSYYNADSSLENADGFAAKLGVGDGNYFFGCRAWNNLDDGIDGYLRGADDVTTTYENTWVIRNGYLEDGSLGEGDGNGFKTGGSDDKDLSHNAILINTIAAGNASDGYDHNSNRGEVTIYNSIAYQNGRNIAFSSTNPASQLTIKNTISFDPADGSDKYNADSTSISNNSWQDVSTSSSDFLSVDIDLLLADRQDDGSLPVVEFFNLQDSSDLIDAGVDVGLDYNGSAPDIGAFETD